MLLGYSLYNDEKYVLRLLEFPLFTELVSVHRHLGTRRWSQVVDFKIKIRDVRYQSPVVVLVSTNLYL